jgi:hypothetical protein
MLNEGLERHMEILYLRRIRNEPFGENRTHNIRDVGTVAHE